MHSEVSSRSAESVNPAAVEEVRVGTGELLPPDKEEEQKRGREEESSACQFHR